MAAVCKLLSFASLVLVVSYHCIILCYRYLRSIYVCLTKEPNLGLRVECFWERKTGEKFELTDSGLPCAEDALGGAEL